MFLHRLDQLEKEAFLELAHHIASVDGSVNEHEQALLQMYLHEMGMDQAGYVIRNLPLEEIIPSLSEGASRNIVFIEILGLIFADGLYEEEEKSAVKELKRHFGFSPEKYERCKRWIRQYYGLVAEGEVLIAAE